MRKLAAVTAWRKALPAMLFIVLLAASGCSQGTAPPAKTNGTSTRPAAQTAPAKPRVPAYHKTLEAARPLPRALSPSQFEGYPVVQAAYKIAQEIPAVLAQQPCYCQCDRSAGHTSLADCWASAHGGG